MFQFLTRLEDYPELVVFEAVLGEGEMADCLRKGLECFGEWLAETCVQGVLLKLETFVYYLEQDRKTQHVWIKAFLKKLELWVVDVVSADTSITELFG